MSFVRPRWLIGVVAALAHMNPFREARRTAPIPGARVVAGHDASVMLRSGNNKKHGADVTAHARKRRRRREQDGRRAARWGCTRRPH